MLAAEAMVKFTSFAFKRSNTVGIWPRIKIKTSASFPRMLTHEIRNTHCDKVKRGLNVLVFPLERVETTILTMNAMFYRFATMTHISPFLGSKSRGLHSQR